MKSKTKLLAFLLLSFTGMLSLQAQNEAQMRVNLANGTQKQIALNQLKTITFGTNALSLNFTDGTSNPYAFSEVETLTFSGIISGIETLAGESGIFSLYPNPAHNLLYLKGVTKGNYPVTIFSPTGSFQMRTRISDPELPINISQLPTGLYLLQINNQVLKFYKL